MTRTHSSLPLYKTLVHHTIITLNLLSEIFHKARELISSGVNLFIKPTPQTHHEASESDESVD